MVHLPTSASNFQLTSLVVLRITRIAFTLLLSPQLLGAREIACPRHGNHETAPVATAPTEGHEHHHQASKQDPPPSEHHTPSDCCPAMSSCSGAAVQVVDNPFGMTSPHNDAPAEGVELVHSRVESPDPPPPKA